MKSPNFCADIPIHDEPAALRRPSSDRDSRSGRRVPKRAAVPATVVLVAAVAMGGGDGGDAEQTLAAKLIAAYDPVRTVACEVRKVTKSSEGTVRFLSRVYYKRPDRIHVQNIAPLPRRIVADGTNFYSCVRGAPKGFSRPIRNLDRDFVISLRKVPGTAMDHLLRLEGLPETELPAQESFPVRRGFKAKALFIVLALDAKGRLARIEFFRSPEMKKKTAQYDYTEFAEVLKGVWIPCRHSAVATRGHVRSEETVHIKNLAVNKSVANALFIAAPYFKNVEFVDSFEKMRP